MEGDAYGVISPNGQPKGGDVVSWMIDISKQINLIRQKSIKVANPRLNTPYTPKRITYYEILNSKLF